jgi:hypothetical protein
MRIASMIRPAIRDRGKGDDSLFFVITAAAQKKARFQIVKQLQSWLLIINAGPMPETINKL